MSTAVSRDTRAALLDRLFDDARFADLAAPTGTSLRELITAVLVIGSRIPDSGQAWREAVQRLGLSNDALTRLMLSDLPHYVPTRYSASQMGCGHIMTAGEREGLPCREYGVESAKQYASDGTWTMLWRCHRHRGELWKAQQRAVALKASGTLPEPMPNRGGLLAAYLPGYDWRATYQALSPSWQPSCHGVSADAWTPRTKRHLQALA